MLRILSTCAGIDRLVAKGDPVPETDFHVPLMSLPKVFKTSLTTIPAKVRYLFADPSLVSSWRAKLQSLNGFRVGINWHGREGQNIVSARRDIPLDFFHSLAKIPGVKLISLQRGAKRDELSASSDRPVIIFPGDDVDQSHGAFMDTAAIMMNQDLVITSDTSVCHLAGALGVAVWTLLPFAADWRWLRDRTDSPWYPTMRLFRQKSMGDWGTVFNDVEGALAKMIEARS